MEHAKLQLLPGRHRETHYPSILAVSHTSRKLEKGFLHMPPAEVREEARRRLMAKGSLPEIADPDSDVDLLRYFVL